MPQRKLKIKKNESSKENRELLYLEYLKTMNKKREYETFKNKVYSYLISYKDDKITKDCGCYKGEKHPEFLPENYWDEELPEMLFDGIRDVVAMMLNSNYRYKPHLFAYKHVASSQTACVNLFVPILESPRVNEILKSLDACPKDFKCVAKENILFHGYQFEFWDGADENSKGILGDHSKQAGTDSDVAIAYYNTSNDLCLWLIEHKLTEREFTTCGAYRSSGNNAEGRSTCHRCSISEILDDPTLCYYHRESKYNYWSIMKDGAAEFYCGSYGGNGCPFRGGMNQLWRNQLLAMALEKNGMYKHVSFSVVHHPLNIFLNDTMATYSRLTNNSQKFNSFTSYKLVDAAAVDPELKDWIKWYQEVYYGIKE